MLIEIYENGQLIGTEGERTLADATADAVDRLQGGFAAALAAGFADAETGITLAIGDGDRAQLDALDNHLTRKGEPDDAQTAVIDIAGGLHPLTVSAYRALIVRAGDYYLGLRMSLATKTLAAQAAATIADADGVNW